MSAIRGVLLAGKFRTYHELNEMSHEDQRNTLIVELAGHTNQSVSHFQSLSDVKLAGAGAVMVFLREAKIRDERALKAISDDDQRNILIVELGAQTHADARTLQGMSNMDLVLLALGNMFPGALPGEADSRGTWIRGVLLAGKFRSHHDLNTMSADDQRNTLIVELTKHTNQSVGHFQAMDNATLAATGALMVFLRETRIRDDRSLKSISDDDQRNILIVEIDNQVLKSDGHRQGSRLQGMNNLALVRIGLGDESYLRPPGDPLRPDPPVLFTLTLTKFVCNDQSDEVDIPFVGNTEDDEPYALVFATDIGAASPAQPVPAGSVNSKMTLVGALSDVSAGEEYDAPANLIWGLSEAPDFISSADNFIVLATMMENDSGSPDQARTVLETAAKAALLQNVGLLTTNRITRAELLRRIAASMNGSMQLATAGIPNPDDHIGPIQELRFSQAELDRLRVEQGSLERSLTFEGDDANYTLKFRFTASS